MIEMRKKNGSTEGLSSPLVDADLLVFGDTALSTRYLDDPERRDEMLSKSMLPWMLVSFRDLPAAFDDYGRENGVPFESLHLTEGPNLREAVTGSGRIDRGFVPKTGTKAIEENTE